MKIKPYNIYILEKEFIEEAETKLALNEDASLHMQWVNKIIKEDSIQGLSIILEELELLNEMNPFKWIKDWGKKKSKALQKKYKDLISGDTFNDVIDYFKKGGGIPKTKKEIAKMKDNPDLLNALSIIGKGEDYDGYKLNKRKRRR